MSGRERSGSTSHGQTMHQRFQQLDEPARIAQGTYYDSEHSVPAVHELHALQAAVQKAASSAGQRKAAASARSAALSAKTAANSTSQAASASSSSGRRLDRQNSSKNTGNSSTTGTSGAASSSAVNGHGLSGSSSASSRLLQADARGPNTPLSQSLGVSAHSNEGRGTKRSRSDSGQYTCLSLELGAS